MNTGTPSKANNNKADDGRWIPWMFVLFFVVIAIVDGIFVYIAYDSFPGVTTEKYYKIGLGYNSLLHEASEQKEMGVQETVSFDKSKSRLTWRLIDKNNSPVDNAVISVKMIRPVQNGYDFDVALSYQGGGVYSGDIKFPLRGQWTAKLEAKWDGKTYRTTYRFATK